MQESCPGSHQHHQTSMMPSTPSPLSYQGPSSTELDTALFLGKECYPWMVGCSDQESLALMHHICAIDMLEKIEGLVVDKDNGYKFKRKCTFPPPLHRGEQLYWIMGTPKWWWGSVFKFEGRKCRWLVIVLIKWGWKVRSSSVIIASHCAGGSGDSATNKWIRVVSVVLVECRVVVGLVVWWWMVMIVLLLWQILWWENHTLWCGVVFLDI